MGLRRALAILLLALAARPAAGCGGDASSSSSTGRADASLPRVQLALDFTANAVHAPIFTAVRTGADRAHGVRLVIRRPGAGPDALKLLASGRLDLGVLDIHDLAIARERGVDVVAVGALVKAPLAALVARASIARPRDLEGHAVGVSGLPSDPAFLGAIIGHDGGRLSRVHQVTIGFNAVSFLVAGKVDAAPVFWNAEGVALRRRGVAIHEFRVERYGAPAYPEVVLVTARRTLERRRAVVDGVVAAIGDGVRSVLARPEPAARQIAAAAGQADIGLVRAQLRALRPAIVPPLRLDRAVLERWAAFDARFGIVERRPDVGRAFAFGVAR